MTEVMRWKLKGFIPGVEGVSKALFQPWVVQAEDFDNATRLFLDAAERCVAAERREKELQQRLTAADERADVLETALEKISARCVAYIEDERDMPEPSVEVCQMIASAALKPAAQPQANVSLADEGEMPGALPQGEPVVYDPEKENKLFEAWARTQSSVSLQLCDIGLYYQRDTGLAHDAWQYRAKLAEQPAPVAVAYQYRQRPLWRKDDNSGWMPWQDCSQEAHADYTASPDLHDWQYETRTLYAGPNQQ